MEANVCCTIMQAVQMVRYLNVKHKINSWGEGSAIAEWFLNSISSDNSRLCFFGGRNEIVHDGLYRK